MSFILNISTRVFAISESLPYLAANSLDLLRGCRADLDSLDDKLLSKLAIGKDLGLDLTLDESLSLEGLSGDCFAFREYPLKLRKGDRLFWPSWPLPQALPLLDAPRPTIVFRVVAPAGFTICAI